jgi:kynurenine 3-monooxygenase
MLIALPNVDRSFTATLFMPYDGEDSFRRLATPDAVATFFDRQFPDLAGSLTSLDLTDFATTPVGRLVTATARRWSFEGAAAVLGDAAHAMAPFLGQGMNCALEDCVCLVDLLQEHDGDTVDAFQAFERLRQPAAEAIARMSLDNYVEMRHTVTQNEHRQKRVAMRTLQERYPTRFVPLYSMVSFSDTSYADALARHEIQEDILRSVFDHRNGESIDWPLARRLVEERLTSDVVLSDRRFSHQSGDTEVA